MGVALRWSQIQTREYNPDEPRDENGEWLSAGGGRDPGDVKVETDKTGTYIKGGASLKYTNWTGTTGNQSHITRSEMGTVPTTALMGLRGAMGEDPHEHYAHSPGSWEKFVADVKENGIKDPIFITVDHNAKPEISEGNHRLEAARVLGLTIVPVEIKYYGHAEDQGTVMDRFLAMSVGRWSDLLMRAYNPDEPRDEKGEWTYGGSLPKEAHDFIQKQVNEFRAAGGTTKVFTDANYGTGMFENQALIDAQGNAEAVGGAMKEAVMQAYDGKGELANEDGLQLDRMMEGIGFTDDALHLGGGSHVAVAYDSEGNVAGAMSFSPETRTWNTQTQSYDSGPVKIGYLGSLGTTPGTGSALQVTVAQVAAALDKPIASTSTDAALSYRTSIGRTLDGYKNSTWDVDQVKDVASIGPVSA
jgi:hypothetical protein